jgi:hypothetical protein
MLAPVSRSARVGGPATGLQLDDEASSKISDGYSYCTGSAQLAMQYAVGDLRACRVSALQQLVARALRFAQPLYAMSTPVPPGHAHVPASKYKLTAFFYFFFVGDLK